MSLVSMKFLLDRAVKEKYAVPAFNCINLETIEAVVSAAEDERSGLIIQFNPVYYRNASVGSLTEVATRLAYLSPMPIAISLDHGSTLEDIMVSIRYGFTGVMIDLADSPLLENIKIVKQVVDLCHPLGISVEAAIGHMPHGKEQSQLDLADPSQALELVQNTGIDALAPAVGNIHGSAHGEEKGSSNLDYDLIKLLSKTTKVPLVLHGGSSLTDQEYQRAIDSGIRKVVIFSDLATAFNRALMKAMQNAPIGINPGDLFLPAKQALKTEAQRKIRQLCSQNRY